MHGAGAPQLPHARVHQGDAGATTLPGRQSGAVAGAATGRRRTRVRMFVVASSGMAEQRVIGELAPAQLAQERRGAVGVRSVARGRCRVPDLVRAQLAPAQARARAARSRRSPECRGRPCSVRGRPPGSRAGPGGRPFLRASRSPAGRPPSRDGRAAAPGRRPSATARLRGGRRQLARCGERLAGEAAPARQARQNGVNTENGVPDPVCTVHGSKSSDAAKLVASTPAARAADFTRVSISRSAAAVAPVPEDGGGVGFGDQVGEDGGRPDHAGR